MTSRLSKVRSGSAFLAVAAVVAVGVGKAGRGLARSQAAAPRETAGLRMGELVGRDARVVILGTDQGMRFDIHSLGGGIVAAGLTAEQVAALLPGQDPRAALAQEPTVCGPLMLADPDRFRTGNE